MITNDLKELERQQKQKELEDFAEKNCILRVVAGSHAYGTNIPTSDWDERGIFVDDISRIVLPFDKVEQVQLTRDDIVLYELSKYMPLLLSQNPNVIELIWTDPSDVIQKNNLGDLLLDNRHSFLSKQVKDSYVGYAQSQLKRIKGHNKWINNPQSEQEPEQKDFMSVVWNYTNIKEFNKKVPLDGFVAIELGDNNFSLWSIDKLNINKKSWIDKRGNINAILRKDFEQFNSNNLPPDMIIKFNKSLFESQHTNWKMYWSWKKNRNEKRSALEESFGYDCYSEDTEFLTENGWKYFDEITDNEKIATFDKNTHILSYEIPLGKIDKLYTGEMIHLHAAHIDVLVTGNHQMIARQYHRGAKTPYYDNWDFIKADSMPETFQLIKCINGINNIYSEPDNIPNDYNLLETIRIMGWYISEGCVTKNGSLLYISQSKPNSKITQRLNSFMNKNLNKCHHVQFDVKGVSNYKENRFYFKKIGKWMRTQCGNSSIEKHLPKWVFDLTPRYKMALLAALLDGDGTKKKHAPLTYVYYTTSKQLADDVQKLALLLNCQTSLYGPYKINSTFKSKNYMYQVHINMKPYSLRHHTRYANTTKMNVENKRVVCFTMPSGTLVTRRNGHIGFHGNCKHAMHLIRLLRSGLDILENGIVPVKRPDKDYLMDIRNGKYTYDEIVLESEKLTKKVEEISKKSSLPSEPNYDLAKSIMLEIYTKQWGLDLKDVKKYKPSLK